MRKLHLFCLLMLVVCLCCSGCRFPWSADIELSLTPADTACATISPGESLSVDIVLNGADKDVIRRYVLILGVWDADGMPIDLDGSNTTPSAYDLFSAEETLPLKNKAIVGNQAVYVQETIPDACRLSMQETAHERYSGCSVRLDLIVQQKDVQTDKWVDSLWKSAFFQNGGAYEADLTVQPQIPCMDQSYGYHWQIKDGIARLAGIGSVTETELVLPTTIKLSSGPELPEAYVITPFLMVQGDYFPGCGTNYAIECTDGTMITDPAQLKQEQYFAAKLYVYDVQAFAQELDTGRIPPMILSRKNGAIFTTQALGYTILAQDYHKDAPLVLNITPNTDTYAYVEDPVNGTAYPVEVLGDAFNNCDSITSVTFGEGAVVVENKMRWAKGGMFAGCDRLTAVYNIPSTVTDMHRTFEDCIALSVTPQIPAGVTDMRHCFRGCVSLTQMPELPETVTDLYLAFENCSSMTGTATIPLGIIDPSDYMALYHTFNGCGKMDCIYIESCPLYPYAAYISSLRTEYLQEHQEKGTCPYCKTMNQSIEKIDGITIIADAIPVSLYEEFADFLDNEVPDLLKEGCNRMTLTLDLSKYYDSSDVSDLAGYYTWPACDVFILMEVGGEVPERTIYHELGHALDYHYDEDELISGSQRWIELQSKEGGWAAMWYNPEVYNEMSAEDQRMETFAIAVSLYYTRPDWLEYFCPNMYEYVEEILTAEQ